MAKNPEQHSHLAHLADKVQDAVGSMVGRLDAAMVSDARTFVKQAAISDMYEIESARLVLARGVSRRVADTAEKMIADHTTSRNHLAAALQTQEAGGIPAPPDELDARRKKMIQHLRLAPSEQVERLYIDQQILAHKEALTLLRSYEKKGDNEQLRAFAAGAVPVVENHLSHVKSVESELAKY